MDNSAHVIRISNIATSNARTESTNAVECFQIAIAKVETVLREIFAAARRLACFAMIDASAVLGDAPLKASKPSASRSLPSRMLDLVSLFSPTALFRRTSPSGPTTEKLSERMTILSSTGGAL